MSEYIRMQIASSKSSIWIAQRQGRTKDGLDKTEQGLLKMLSMSGKGDFEADMSELSFLPIAISYEFEPCDIEKAVEVYVGRRQKYVKSEGEDLESILTGMKQWKGNIHLEATESISPKEISDCSKLVKNERFMALSKIIDKRIHSAYRLWPNNYIAADLLSNEGHYCNRYSNEQRDCFIDYMQKRISAGQKSIDAHSQEKYPFVKEELEDIFLRIYANPVLYFE